MKRISAQLIIGVFFLAGGYLNSFADQGMKIGIIDLSQVYSVFFRQSEAVRNLEQLISSFKEEVENYEYEIHALELSWLAAVKAEDEKSQSALSQAIFEKEQFLADYTRIKKEQIKNRREELAETDEFYQHFIEVLEYIAEHEGFSFILRLQEDEGVLYYIKEIDITEKVIEELQKRYSQQQ